MPADCPDLELLDRHADAPDSSDPALSRHISSCPDCLSRLAELSRNQALFAELNKSAGVLIESLPAATAAPTQIGEYEIIGEIGRGGMGVVYEALQRRPQRRVALKLLRGEYAASSERVRLFEREIRALARLKHPGITAIHESGASSAGPYYVMEFIQGVPLGEHAGRAAKSLDDRLRLFLKVCAAIAYAHQHGVIHRDLKPGNILVEEGGSPRVLDFGLARITDGDVTMASIAMDTGRIVGTLAYMSPEQTRGESGDIDVRSDLYSLGVILYELLTGALPYDVPRNSVPMAVKSICEAAPVRPSIAAKSRDDARLLAGDLETILLKAIEKRPDERYQSVSAMAEDVERFLAKQPIIARPHSAIYQLRKFAQRNRVLVGGMIAVVLALATGVVTTGWQWYRARTAERAALDESATNAEINRFLTTMFSAVDPALGGPDVKVVQILKKSAAEIDSAFADRPRVALALKSAIGRAYESLTLYDEALPLFVDAMRLAEQLLDPRDRERLSLRYCLAMATAHVNGETGAYDEFVKLAEDQTNALGPDDRDTLLTRHFVAVLETERGETDKAERTFRDVLDRRTRALGPEDRETMQSMSDLSLILRRVGKQEEGDELARRVHALADRVLGPDAPQTILYAAYEMMTARSSDEYEVVEPRFRELAERATRVYGPTHQVTLSFVENQAQLLELLCRFAESETVARDLYRRKALAYGDDDPRTFDALKRVARILRLQERYDESEVLTRRYLALNEAAFGKDSPQALGAIYELIPVLDGAKKLPEAMSLAEHALALRMSRHHPDTYDVALARIQISDILNKLGRADEGRDAAEAGLDSLNVIQGADPLLIAWAKRNLGISLRDLGLYDVAESLVEDAMVELDHSLGECHPFCEETRDHLARLREMRETSQRRARARTTN